LKVRILAYLLTLSALAERASTRKSTPWFPSPKNNNTPLNPLRMPDEHTFTLRQADQVPSDFAINGGA
jgi:hypothetical protein